MSEDAIPNKIVFQSKDAMIAEIMGDNIKDKIEDEELEVTEENTRR